MELEIPFVKRDNLDPTEVEAFTRERFLEAVRGRVPGPVEESPSPGDNLRETLQRVLMDIHKNPFDGVRSRLKRMGLSMGKGLKILGVLEDSGLVESVEIPISGRRPTRFHVLTQKGAEFLGLDWERNRLRGKGEAEHVLVQNLIARAVNGVTEQWGIDVVRISDSKVIGYEYERNSRDQRFLERVRRDLEICDEVILVVRASKEKKLAEPLLSEFGSKVSVKTISEVLGNG